MVIIFKPYQFQGNHEEADTLVGFHVEKCTAVQQDACL